MQPERDAIDRWITETVGRAPELSSEQRDKLVLLLRNQADDRRAAYDGPGSPIGAVVSDVVADLVERSAS